MMTAFSIYRLIKIGCLGWGTHTTVQGKGEGGKTLSFLKKFRGCSGLSEAKVEHGLSRLGYHFTSASFYYRN